jgi:Mrp family chromosome partitioning ATPase
MQTVREDFDLVLIDAPPVAIVTDAAIISTKVDGVIYAVRAHEVDRKQLAHAAEQLAKVKANVIGYVLNGVQEESENYYYYYNYAQDEQLSRAKTEKKPKKQKRSRPKKSQVRRQPHHMRPLQLPEKDDGFFNVSHKGKGISSEEE